MGLAINTFCPITLSFTLLRSYKALSMTEPACRKFIRAVRYTTDNIYPSGQLARRGCPVQ